MDRTEAGGYGGARDTPGIFVAKACFALALVRVMLDQILREHDKAPLLRVGVTGG